LRVIYVPDPQPDSYFVITAYELQGKAAMALSAPRVQEAMKQSKFSSGWDEERVSRVLEHYESQIDEEAVAEDEAALSASTVMDIPADLVPTVRELIAKHKKSA
jgi:hypothetical protein